MANLSFVMLRMPPFRRGYIRIGSPGDARRWAFIPETRLSVP